MKKKIKIGIVGIGNLGWNLGLRLFECGFEVTAISGSLNGPNKKFAKRIDTKLYDDPKKVAEKSKLVFVCVPDDQIKSASDEISGEGIWVAHCSGSTPLIEGDFKGSGVLYPFQTFSKFFPVDWSDISIFTEGSNDEMLEMLDYIAHRIARDVHQVESEQRRIIHIAGVIGANFTNHLLHQTKLLLDAHKLDFNVLQPLMEETIRKAFEHGPAGAQTGPAKRNDQQMIQRHLDLLQDQKSIAEIYDLFSKKIIDLNAQ